MQKAQDRQLWGAAAPSPVPRLHWRAAATTHAFQGYWGPWVHQAGAPVTMAWQLLGHELAALLPQQLPRSPGRAPE